MIHPLADVSPRADLGADVEIGPFCVVEADAQVGDRCRLSARSTIKAGARLGSDNVVCEGAVVGGMPQHLQQPDSPGGLVIGNRNVIRENVTLHRAMHAGTNTTIGDDCLLMVDSHVAHDCQVGDHVVLTNNVMLAGHVTVGDRAYLGGGAAVHQHCRIGRIAMVGGMSRLDQDVPPFVMVDGETNRVVGLNRVGLRRAGVESAERNDLKLAYQLIFREQLPLDELLSKLRVQFEQGPAAEFSEFLAESSRGFIRERRRTGRPTLRIIGTDEQEQAAAHAA